MKRCWDEGMKKCWDERQYWDAGIKKGWNEQMLECWNAEIW